MEVALSIVLNLLKKQTLNNKRRTFSMIVIETNEIILLFPHSDQSTPKIC
jgi:hypothetical protein